MTLRLIMGLEASELRRTNWPRLPHRVRILPPIATPGPALHASLTIRPSSSRATSTCSEPSMFREEHNAPPGSHGLIPHIHL